MAVTAVGARLTRLHRQAQLVVRARTLRRLVDVWPMFDPLNIDESWARMQPAVMEFVQLGRQESIGLATDYYVGFRTVEAGPGRIGVAIPDAEEWRPSAEASMRITGPVRAKQLTAQGRPDIAAQTFVTLAGAAGRQVINGGREVVYDSIWDEPLPLESQVGWRRVTAVEPCKFCQMLADRGAVYIQETAQFQAHDHCACTAEPDYRGPRLSAQDMRRQRHLALQRQDWKARTGRIRFVEGDPGRVPLIEQQLSRVSQLVTSVPAPG